MDRKRQSYSRKLEALVSNQAQEKHETMRNATKSMNRARNRNARRLEV